jgi:YD repeat-containing protein
VGNRLVTVTTSSGITTTFKYDGDGQRVKKVEQVRAAKARALARIAA